MSTAWVDDGSPNGLESNKSVLQWIYDDGCGVDIQVDPGSWNHVVSAADGQSRVEVTNGFTPWSGKTLRVYTNPGTEFIGAATYVNTTGASINTSVQWETGDPFYLNANSDNTDEIPNWIYDRVVPAP